MGIRCNSLVLFPKSLKMPYLSGISWSKAFIVGFVDVYKGGDLIDIWRRSLLMRMLSVIKISFFTFTHACLSSMIFFHTRDVVERVAIKFIVWESVWLTERPLKFRRRCVDRGAKNLCGVYIRKQLRRTAHDAIRYQSKEIEVLFIDFNP